MRVGWKELVVLESWSSRFAFLLFQSLQTAWKLNVVERKSLVWVSLGRLLVVSFWCSWLAYGMQRLCTKPMPTSVCCASSVPLDLPLLRPPKYNILALYHTPHWCIALPHLASLQVIGRSITAPGHAVHHSFKGICFPTTHFWIQRQRQMANKRARKMHDHWSWVRSKVLT